MSQPIKSRSPFLTHTPDLPKNEDFIDENGIRTQIEYTVNENGKKVKVRFAELFDLPRADIFRQSRLPDEPSEHCRSQSSTTSLPRGRNGPSLDWKKETNRGQIEPPPLSLKM